MKHKSLFVGVLIVLCVVLGVAFPSFAQYTLSLEAKDAGGGVKTQFAPGEDLYLNINLDNAGGVAGCAFTLTFPANVLEPPATDADGKPVNSGDITSAFPFIQTFPVQSGLNPEITHRENSAEAGKIYFAGAEIAADGGAVYDTGPVTLFTVKFKVKTDAPAGSFSPTLTQTELLNPAAGYGTDVDGDGEYDAGDTLGKVPVLVGAVAQGEPGFDNFNCSDYPNTPCAFPPLLGDQTQALASLDLSRQEPMTHGDEVAIDFGALGIWHNNGGAWNKISDAGAECMMNFNGSFLGDFGAAGVWRFNGTAWQQFSAADPDNTGNAMIGFNNGVIINFGASGLWFTTDGIAWSMLSGASPQFMATYGNYAVFDFGSLGVWRYEATSPTPTWIQLTPADPDNTGGPPIVAFKNGIIIDFGSSGVWFTVDGSAWDNISSANPEFMTTYGNYALFDFGPLGVWRFDGAAWSYFSAADPDNSGDTMMAFGSGVIIDFGSSGLWSTADGIVWDYLSAAKPESMAVYGNYAIFDFGPLGVWQFDGTGWSFVSSADPDNLGNGLCDVNLVN